MGDMNRLALWTTLLLLGLAFAVVDLVTGWTVHAGAVAIVVLLGLFGASIALFVAMLIAVIRDRRWIVAHSSDARWVLARASRGLRWSSLFAIGFCLLLFANCTGSITSGPDPQVSNAVQDPARFWTLTAAVLAPLVLALLMAPALTSAAERLATGRPQAARRLGRLAWWSVAVIVAAALVTVVVGFFIGISSCDVGPSAGYCAAGAGSIMNLLSVGALALLLPYLGLVTWALQVDETTRRIRPSSV
jgi:hypothetical protein